MNYDTWKTTEPDQSGSDPNAHDDDCTCPEHVEIVETNRDQTERFLLAALSRGVDMPDALRYALDRATQHLLRSFQ